MDAAEIEDRSPWHEGELELQRRAGVAERMTLVGRRNIRDHLIDQHRAFYPQLPFVVAAAVDREGDVWATAIAGRPGFLASPDPLTLTVAAARDPDDPADAGLDDGASIGLLGMEFGARRRNRLNGVLRRRGPDRFAVEVRESFGNCPRYIRRWDVAFAADPAGRTPARVERLAALDDAARATIETAETLFVASYVDRPKADRTVDVSHRGGRPGFARAGNDGRITIPDFAGNGYFNTLGNIRANPRAGLLFADVESGDLLQIAGDAEVAFDDPEIAAFRGAERLLKVRPRRVVRRRGALPLRFRAVEDGASPHIALTGDWNEAAWRRETVG